MFGFDRIKKLEERVKWLEDQVWAMKKPVETKSPAKHETILMTPGRDEKILEEAGE